MLAGVPSRTPSQSSRSAAPADRAGRRTSSASSTIATPSLTASSTVCRAGDGGWWTTSSRDTRASSPPAAGRSRGNVVRGHPGLGGEASGEIAVGHEDADGVQEVHPVVALLQRVGQVVGRTVGEEHAVDAAALGCRLDGVPSSGGPAVTRRPLGYRASRGRPGTGGCVAGPPAADLVERLDPDVDGRGGGIGGEAGEAVGE